VNPYSYVANDPLGATDPTGEVKAFLSGYRNFIRDGDLANSPYFTNRASAEVSNLFLGDALDLYLDHDKMSGAQMGLKTAFMLPWAKSLDGGRLLIRSGSKYVEGATAFRTFNELKSYLGRAGDGNAWHHIVEQHADNIEKFGAEMIQNTKNVVEIAHRDAGALHRQITGYYNSVQSFG
jgi:hypothetical protein